jgi:hypothetical protein
MNRNEVGNDLEESTRVAQDAHQASLWTALPCIVTKVNLAAMTLEATPAIQGVNFNEDGTQTPVNLPTVADVPICFPSAGGFLLTLPIVVGDEVLVIFASRCIDAWWQLGGVQPPLELRMHDLSDGFAIPGPRSTPRVAPAISSSAAQLRNNAGTIYLEVNATGVKIMGNLTVVGEVTANGIPLSTHIHTGVQTGGGDTGAPIV